MGRRKPKVGDRVFWQSEDGPKEMGTIIEVSPSGTRIEVKWDVADEFGQDVTQHDFHPASGVKFAPWVPQS